VLIGPDTGSGYDWGDAGGSYASKIEDSEVPVIGLGRGGSAFFSELGYEIGWGKSWSGSGRDVYVINADDALWNQPNDLSIPGSNTLTIYNSTTSFQAVHYPSSITGIVGRGRQVGDSTHYPIITKDTRYMLWGWAAGPNAMTSVGKQVFVNAARLVRWRLFIINPGIILQPLQPIQPGP
jgi:hypothetical protein